MHHRQTNVQLTLGSGRTDANLRTNELSVCGKRRAHRTTYASDVGNRIVRHIDASGAVTEGGLTTALEVARTGLVVREQVRKVGAVRTADQRQGDEGLVNLLHRGGGNREGQEDSSEEGRSECHCVSLLSLAEGL